ncbi:MAG: DUF4870 domain-containing protein [Thermogutta sp.]|nr:DUF4870 domain-containing protein [Thermogutta sp.]
MTVSEELERLHRLHQEGAISDEEYAAAKQRVLSGETPNTPPARGFFATLGGLTGETPEARIRFWTTAVHLSLLLGFVIMPLGFASPVLIWLWFRERFPEVDRHGKNVINFLICWGIAFGLCLAIGGAVAAAGRLFPLGTMPIQFAIGGAASILTVTAVVLPIIAAVKAHRGEEWRYPLVYRFLR